MKAIIPAAGHGTRFAPVTRVVPKEMLPIGNRPALELIIEEAREAGVDEIVVVISEGKELIRRYFEGDSKIKFVYQREQKGLGHAVLQAAEEVRGERENVLILLGDAIVTGCRASKEMVELSRANGNCSVIGCERVPMERVSRYGVMKLDGGRIVDMVEKPSVAEAPSDIVVAGRYLLDPSVFEYLADQSSGVGGEIQLTDAIRRMLAAKSTMAYVYPGRRHDIGNPEGYFKTLEAYYAG